MMLLRNSDATQAALDETSLTAADGFILTVGATAIPTVDITPGNHRLCNIQPVSSTVTGAVTIFTAPLTGYRFYLTGVSVSFVKNATCDIASGTLQVKAATLGQSTSVASIAVLTLTAERDTAMFNFQKPLLVDLGGAIVTSTDTFTVGALVRAYQLYGYLVKIV